MRRPAVLFPTTRAEMSIQFVYVLTLFNMTSVRAGRVLLPLYALELGAQPLAIGLLAATFSAFPMALSWQAGRLSDRYGARWPLLLGAAGGACGMLVPYLVPGLPALYVAAAMNGVAFAYFNVTLQNLVGIVSAPDDRARSFSNFSLLLAFVSFLGPLISGFSIDYAGLTDACLYLVVLSLVPIVPLAIWGGRLPRGSGGVEPKERAEATLALPGLWRVLATSSLMVAGIDLFQFYMPIYGHSVGLSASAIGIVLAAFPAASFVVRLIMPRLVSRLGSERVLAYAFYVGAASLVLVPFFQSAVALALIAFVFGLGMGCGQPITMALTFGTSAEGRSGEALGLRLTVNHLTRMIGPIAFGSIGSAFGLPPVFWTNALMLAGGGLLRRRGKAGDESDH